MTEAGSEPQGQIALAFRLLTSRRPDAKEMAVLQQLLSEQHAEFEMAADDAKALLAIGDHQPRDGLDSIRLAAITVVVQAIMNYDEAVTKR